jgi:hypothetical protein
MCSARSIPTARAHRNRPRRSALSGARAAAFAATLVFAAARPASPDTAIPVVHGFTPNEGVPGTVVKIAGENFDTVLWIEFAGGLRVDFRLFSTTMLKVEVPVGAESGPILLRTEQGGAWTPSSFRVITPPAGGLALAPPFPSPGSAPFHLTFNLPSTRRVQLDVMDAHGRRVRRLLNDMLERGPQQAIWDGRDAAGRRAGPGVYLVMLRLEEGIVTRRLVVLH